MAIDLAILAEDPFMRAAENLRRIPEAYDVHDFSSWRDWSRQELLDRIRQVEVVLTGRISPRLPDALADDPGELRWVCHFYGTVRHLLRREHIESGLLVTNWGNARRPVAEGAVALLLAMLKQIKQLDRYCTTGQDRRIWQHYFPTLPQMRTGLYGLGPIGQHVARMLLALGANLCYYDPHAEHAPPELTRCDSLDELFESSDAVVVICGLNDQTRGSVGRDLLEKLPQGGVLVNVARGPIVVEEELARLVAAGRILAGCDVIEDESSWPDSPLAGLEGSVLTRHRVGRGKGYPPDKEPLRPIPDYVLDNLRAYANGGQMIHAIPAPLYDLKT
jgi:phosphoglycerate dehydrogenase-like enzyme